MATKKPYTVQPAQTLDYNALMANLNALPSEAAAEEKPSVARRIGDTAVQFGQGAVTGVKMMSDIFGANNAVSRELGDVNTALDGLLSATAQGDKQKVAQIMQEAEGKGWGEQVIAGLKAAGVDPVGLAANALGTSLPTMATMLIPGAGPAAVATRMGAGVAMGAGQGVGGIKGQIYDETKRKWQESGATPEQAEAKAQEAAAYGGENSDQMAMGGLLGMGSVLGAERALGKVLHGTSKAGPGVIGRVATSTAAETGTEMLQGGQEKFATNTALNRQGFDVDPMSGVIANATLEGVAAAPMGAIAGIPKPAVAAAPAIDPAKEAADQIRATETLPESGAMTRAMNAGTEAKAMAVEAGAPLVDEQAMAEPAPEPVDDPVRDQILALPAGAREDALRAYAVLNRPDAAKGVLQLNRKLLDRLLAENQPAPVLGERLTDTDMGAMLGGGGMAGNADPIAGMLGGQRDSTANAIDNVYRAAESRPPMPASDAARMLDEARNRGLDLTVAEHPAGGFVIVPPAWVTPDMAAQGEASLAETIARMQQADAAPVERAPRTSTAPVDLSLPTDPVENFVGNLRTVNTPAARAYVRDFDAGRITPADVQRRMVVEQGVTPDQRIARAAAEAPATADPVADRLQRAAAQGMATPAPTDILNPAGQPFKTRMAADRAAKQTPGAVVPVEGGFVVRPQEPVNVQDAAQGADVTLTNEGDIPEAAPVEALAPVAEQPAGPAAGVPAEGVGTVEAAGVEGATPSATPIVEVQDNYGRTHRVRQSDLYSNADRIPTVRKNGEVVAGEEIPRSIVKDAPRATVPDTQDAPTIPLAQQGAFDGGQRLEADAGDDATAAGAVPTPGDPVAGEPAATGAGGDMLDALDGRPGATGAPAGDVAGPTAPAVGAPLDALQNQAAAPELQAQAATKGVANQPITRAQVDSAVQQASSAVGARIDAMSAQEVQKIAARFLPTMGVRVPAGKARIKEAVTSAGPRMNWAAAAAEFGAELPQDAMSALQADVEGRVQEGAGPVMPAENAAIPPASATHTDPGQAPEGVTPAVVAQSVQKAARNEAVKPSEMRQWIVGEIDKAMLGAPEKDATEFVSFDVPGDGTFKVQKSRERLQEFRKKVLASPGFKDRGQDQSTKLPEQIDNARNGSGSTVEAVRNFLADGDVQGAVEFAKLKGVEFTPVEPRASMTANGKFKRVPASVKSSVPSVAEGLTQVEAEQINQYLTADRPDAVQGVNPRVPPENRTSAVTPEAGKEPWQMTALEFSQQEKGNPHWDQSYAGKDDGAYLADTAATHAQLVREAVAAGKLDAPQSSSAPSDFIPTPDGGLDYGEITPEMGKAMRRQAGKIRLRQGNEAWGLTHIEARHGEQFKSLGFQSAKDFIVQVAGGFNAIYKGAGAGLSIVLETGRTGGRLMVQLEPSSDGDFYDVKTASPIRAGQYKNEKPLWQRAGTSAPTAESSSLLPRDQNGDGSVTQPAPAAQPDAPKLPPDVASPLVSKNGQGVAKDTDKGVAMFSRTAAGMSPEEAVAMFNSERPALQAAQRRVSDERMASVQRMVAGMKQRWAQAPEIVIARNMQDEVVPQSVRDHDARLKKQGATGEARGFIQGNKVYLLSDELAWPEQIAETLFHEVLGHYGLRGAFGDALTPILKQVAALHKPAVQAKAAEYGLSMANEKQRLQAAEEVLAEMAQTTPELGYVKRAIAAIRTWLRANVPGFKQLALTDAEIVRSYILPARGYVTRSKETPEQSLQRAMMAFSRGSAADQTQSEAFKRWYGDWQNTADAAEQMESDRGGAQASRNGRGTPIDGVQRPAGVDQNAARANGAGRITFTGASGPTGADGAPVRLYHGTKDDIAAFDLAHPRRKDKGWLGRGVYLTSNLDDANQYARAKRGDAGPNLMPLYANVRNPYEATAAEKSRLKQASEQEIDAFTEALKAKGHDGVVLWDEGGDMELVAFNPANVKSAIGNNGNFDPEDGRINFSRTSVSDASTKQNLLNRRVSRAGSEAPRLSGSNDSGESLTLSGQTAQGKVSSNQVADELSRLLTLESAGDPLFSRTTDAAKAVGDTLKSITVANVKKRAGFKLTDYLGIGLQALGRRQIVDIYGDLLPLTEYNRLVQQMEADKNEGGAEADQLVTQWAKLDDEGKLADLMHDATLAQIDPAADFVDGDNEAQYQVLQRKYNALSDEAKKVYADTRDAYKAHHAKVRSAIKERIERSEIKGERKAALLKQMDDDFFKAVKGVYFPLARFGQYVVTVKAADGKIESVSRAETKAEAEALRSNLLSAFPRDKGFSVGRVMLSKEFVADRDAVGRGFMTELYQVLDKQDMDAAQRAELEDTLGQLYLSSLPDLSWAKHGIHRKGTPGFSQDARRAYAQNMFHGARYLAKLRYSDLMQDELTAMQRHVDDWRDVEDFDQNSAQRVVTEMYKRHESLMNPQSNALSTGLTSLGFVFHLGLSPASAMVNLSQTALVAYPIMGAKWGFGKASAALLKASAEAAKGKNDITGSLNEDERAAYDEAVRAGTIDVTMAHDLAGIAQGEDAGVMWKIRPVMRWASFLFHHAERFNRQVTFVAAYRLAREAGADQKAAFEQATKATYDGHFDYGAANRPRIMQGNVAKVLLLFKQYGQNMVYTLARNAQQSMKGETPEARAQARKALGGLLATHAAAAGVLGLPMVTTLLAAASMIGGDDDEPWDAKVALQNMLADTFGQKPAEVMARGLSRLTPWDISGRVGLDKLIFPDVQEGLEGARLWESAATQALGPVGGIVGGVFFKGPQLMSEGHYLLGLEAMLPAALRQMVKSVRYATQGAQDKTGVVIKDDVSTAGVAGQFMGFSPSEVRLAQEGKSAIYQEDKAIGERRQALLSKAARATREKDAEARADAMKEIERFNQKNPKLRITPLNVLQSVRNSQKRIDQAEGGVYLPKNRRDAMEAGRFAVVE